MTLRNLGMTPAAIEKETGIRLRYLDNLVNLHCSQDLLALDLFPNIKEVTESFAAYRAALHYLTPRGWKPGDETITGVFVGDGNTPRTGATFAFRSRWQCISVDPRMKPSWCSGGRKAARVERLHSHKLRIEDLSIVADRAVVVAVHSHADLASSVAAVKAREVAVISMECCVPLTLPTPPDFSYNDPGVLSPHNRIDIWLNAAVPA